MFLVTYPRDHELQGLLDKPFTRTNPPTKAERRHQEWRVRLVLLRLQPPLGYALVGIFEISLVQAGYPGLQQHYRLRKHIFHTSQ